MAKIFLLLIISGSVFSARADKKDDARLMKLIKEEEKALLAVPPRKRWPALYWKVMLLNMEKFRIVRSRENRKMLEESPETIARKGRDYYFRESLVSYKKIKKMGRLIIKRWPAFKHNDEIYYSLAAITLDRNNQGEIAREVGYYLKKGLKVASKDSVVYRKLSVKMADHYYHFKKYKKAAQYYLRSIKYDEDRWHTRSLFNLAWSLISINRPKEARKYIRDSLNLSLKAKKNGRYVDYSDNVLDSFPFFVDEGNLEKSVRFFENKVLFESSESMLRAAENSRGFGKYKLADYFYKKAFEIELKQGGWNAAFEIVKKKLDFYVEIRRHTKIIKYVRSLAEKHKKKKMLDGKQRKILVERIKRHIRILQDKSAAEQINKVLFHFDTLKMLNPKKRASYTFYQGEALYAQKKYRKALDYYRNALKMTSNDKKITKNIFDSLIKSLVNVEMNAAQKKKWNTYIYVRHIKIFPVHERSRKMYQKLYNIYYKDKKYKKCKGVLNMYVKNYPHRKGGEVINREDIEKHQVMISKIIDHYVKGGRYAEASREIKWLKREEFAFDKKYVAKVANIFHYKVFESVKGEKNFKARNEKYQKIYNDTFFPSFVRSDSAWYIGEMFIQMKKSSQARLWIQRSIDLLGMKDGLKRQKNVLEMVVKMIYLQDFVTAEQLAKMYFVRYCRERYDLKRDFYNASVLYALIGGKSAGHVMKNFRLGHECQMKENVLFDNIKVVADFFRDNGNIDELKKLYQNYGKSGRGKKYFKGLFLDYYWESFIAGDKKGQARGLEILKDEKLSKEGDVVNVFHFQELIQEWGEKNFEGFSLYDSDDKFDEKIFNQKLENEVVQLNNFKASIEKFMVSGHPQVLVYGNQILYKKFQSFGRAILNVRPAGVDDNYKKTFLQAMKPLGMQFMREAKNKKGHMRNIIRKADILPGIHHKHYKDAHYALSWGK